MSDPYRDDRRPLAERLIGLRAQREHLSEVVRAASISLTKAYREARVTERGSRDLREMRRDVSAVIVIFSVLGGLVWRLFGGGALAFMLVCSVFFGIVILRDIPRVPPKKRLLFDPARWESSTVPARLRVERRQLDDHLAAKAALEREIAALEELEDQRATTTKTEGS